MKLTTKRLILRDITMKDRESLVKHINNLNVSKWLLVVSHPYTMKDAKWFVNHCAEKSKDKPKTSYSFVIELKEKPGVIGGWEYLR